MSPVSVQGTGTTRAEGHLPPHRPTRGADAASGRGAQARFVGCGGVRRDCVDARAISVAWLMSDGPFGDPGAGRGVPRRGSARGALLDDLATRCGALVDDGLFKSERVIASPQSAHIDLADGRTVLNLCANNYLGLADHPDVIEAAAPGARHATAIGMASVRFICGTQTVHKELEARLAVPRHRRHDPLLVVLRRQRRAVRDHPRRAGLRHHRCAQPCLDHRRHPPVQGPSGCATTTTTWPAGAFACRRPPTLATG